VQKEFFRCRGPDSVDQGYGGQSDDVAEIAEHIEEIIGSLRLDLVEVVDGLAAGFHDGGNHAGFFRLADIMVGVADDLPHACFSSILKILKPDLR
jgi:hypothetical protein